VSDVTEPFTLSENDKHHPLWLRLKAHFEERLAAARRRNDHHLSEPETALVRGEIKFLKATISLGDELPPQDG
jgi:hypothetical protein